MTRRRTTSFTLLVITPLALALATAAYILIKPKASNGTAMKSLAVLPFKPLDMNSDDEYLGLGITDDLITRLSRLKQVIVRPTSSVRKYTAPDQDSAAAGRELGVEAVLTGSIRRAGDRVRINVQLVSVASGAPIWADKFDLKSTDMLAMQDSISAQAARALTVTLTGEESRMLAKHYTEDSEAHKDYLRARYYLNKRTTDGLKKAEYHFQQAVKNDSNYALAYAGLADTYILLFWFSNVTAKPSETFPKAREAAMEALKIDPALAEAHTSLAMVKNAYDWDWPGVESEFKQAIQLNPSYPTAHHWYAFYLSMMERHEEAIREINRAQELDPISLIISTDVGAILWYARQYDRAIEQCRKTLEMDANFAQAHLVLAESYEKQRMHKEAFAEFVKAQAIFGSSPEKLAALKEAYTRSGIKGYWQKEVDLAREDLKQNYSSAARIACLYALLGEKDLAFAWLERAYDERDPILGTLKVDPDYDGLRSDTRFQGMLRRVGLKSD